MNYKYLYNKYKNKYLDNKYKLNGGINFDFSGGLLYIMLYINDNEIKKKLQELRNQVLKTKDNYDDFHITLFNIKFNIHNRIYKKIKEIIKEEEFIKYINTIFYKINNNMILNYKSVEVLGRIWDNGFDGRFITLSYNIDYENKQKIKQFREQILIYILKKCNITYNETHFYKDDKINNLWLYKGVDKKKKLIFAINEFDYPLVKWTPHISIVSFNDFDEKNETKLEKLINNTKTLFINNSGLGNILFNKINKEILVSIRKKTNDKWKHIVYKKINYKNEIFYGNFKKFHFYNNNVLKLHDLELENFISGDYYFNNNYSNINPKKFNYYELIFNKDKGKLKKVEYNNKEDHIIYYK